MQKKMLVFTSCRVPFTQRRIAFSSYSEAEANWGRMQLLLCNGLRTRTGSSCANEAKSQQEESESLEEDVQVVAPGSEYKIVRGAYQEEERNQDLRNVNPAAEVRSGKQCQAHVFPLF